MKIFIKIIIFFCITSVLNIQKTSAEEKIKIGLWFQLTGKIVKWVNQLLNLLRLAINKIEIHYYRNIS